MVRLRFYADKDLEMTAALKLFQHAFTQGEFEMVEIGDISEAEDGQGFDAKVHWVRFDEGEFLGVARDFMGRRPAVCQVGAAKVEA